MISAVYTRSPSEPVNAEALPLPTVMSPTANPFTPTEKVKVAVNGESLVAGTPLMATVGPALAVPMVTVRSVKSAAWLPARSTSLLPESGAA